MLISLQEQINEKGAEILFCFIEKISFTKNKSERTLGFTIDGKKKKIYLNI